MKNLFIPGVQATSDDFELIQKLFQSEKISVECLLPNHSIVNKLNKETLIDELYKKIDLEREEVTLICHAAGCNIGIMLSTHLAVQKLILISPEVFHLSKKEKAEIKKESQEKYGSEISDSENGELSFLDKAILNHQLSKTRKWALEELEKVDIPSVIIYSEGDYHISKVGVECLATELEAETISLESNEHNPLIGEQGKKLVKQMKVFLK